MVIGTAAKGDQIEEEGEELGQQQVAHGSGTA
jgi:hypothetical protein